MKESNGLLNSYSSSDGCQGQDAETKSCTGGLCRKIGKFATHIMVWFYFFLIERIKFFAF